MVACSVTVLICGPGRHLQVNWREGLRGRISKLGAEAALSAGAARVPRMTREMVTYDGRTQTQADWAKELGLSKGGLTTRINTLGVERAILEPFRKKPTPAEMD